MTERTVQKTVFSSEWSEIGQERKSAFTGAVRDACFAGEINLPAPSKDDRIFLQQGIVHPVPVMAFRTNRNINMRRSAQHARRDQMRRYSVQMVTEGAMKLVDSSAGSVIARKGDILILDSSRSFLAEAITDSHNAHGTIYATLPAHLFHEHLAHLHGVVPHGYSIHSPEGRVVHDILHLLNDVGETIGEASSLDLVNCLVKAVARLANEASGGGSRRCSISEMRFQQIKTFIDMHFSTPSLSVADAASACGISSRHVREILKSSDNSFSSMLWTKRLEQACEWLRAPGTKHHSIAEVATMCGYRNAAHLSSSFRKHMDQTPSAYRKSQFTATR